MVMPNGSWKFWPKVTVETAPAGVTIRTAELSKSLTKTLPFAATAHLTGLWKRAATPTPSVVPNCDAPATVDTEPTMPWPPVPGTVDEDPPQPAKAMTGNKRENRRSEVRMLCLRSEMIGNRTGQYYT